MTNASRIYGHRLHATILTVPRSKPNQSATSAVYIYYYLSFMDPAANSATTIAVGISIGHRGDKFDDAVSSIYHRDTVVRCGTTSVVLSLCLVALSSAHTNKHLWWLPWQRYTRTVKKAYAIVGAAAIEMSRTGLPQLRSARRRDQTHFNSLRFRCGVPNKALLQGLPAQFVSVGSPTCVTNIAPSSQREVKIQYSKYFFVLKQKRLTRSENISTDKIFVTSFFEE